ncbi:hypothetical protein CV102_00495 [Natronococcus pandeyae]|uniref:DUF8130 domain-containing protein n=1 Tax=Natronococcus pandeyae TaxID=2055836 RepID=A0A8J8Q9X5_9EURY|nr:hypothetical protein [Natronococcus pandeyae]TYL40095.1 hypothetical protein CV102_00495 [Natronococcus pandeyae]
MNRRTALTLSGTAATTLLAAGCLSDVGDADDPGGTGETEDDENGDEDESRYVVALEDAPLTDETEHARLEVDLVDPEVAPGDPAQFSATLTNATDETLVVSSGAPSPFGVVWASPADGDGRSSGLTLWSDAYEESSHVGTDGKRVEGVNDIALVEELEAGETVERTFELHLETPALEVGEYEAEIGCGVGPEDGDSEGIGVALSFSIERGGDEHDGDENEEDGNENEHEDEPGALAYEVADEVPSLDPDADVPGGTRGDVVLVLESEAEATEAFESAGADTFVAETAFETETLVYVQTEAPQTCYRTVIRSLSWEDDTLAGRVALERTADDHEPCGEAITYPAALARVATGARSVEATDLEFLED